MVIEKIKKESFVVIGKEGSTLDGEGFVGRLWQSATSHFDEVKVLAKKNEKGELCGFWGAMTDFSRTFNPWENFNKGLYLAGVECNDNAEAPSGWTKWVIPAYTFISIMIEQNNTFSIGIQYLKDNGYKLVGAVHDFTCPKTGKNYMFFPIEKI